MISDLLYRLRALFQRRSVEDELEEELRFHLESQAEKNVQHNGRSREEAIRDAALRFGGIEQVKEDCRENWGIGWLGSLLADFRHAARVLRKLPVFTLVAVLSLAIGIGSNTAIFGLLDRVVFRPLPVEAPHELVLLTLAQKEGQPGNFSYPLFSEIARQQTALGGMFAASDFPVKDLVLRAGPAAATGSVRLASGSYFQVLRVRPALGRVYAEADDIAGAPPVAVISNRFWERHFRSHPGVIGQSLRINGAEVAIVGVAPREFFGEIPGTVPDLWIPLSQQPRIAPTNLLQARFATWLSVMGRLRPGVPQEAATSELGRLLDTYAHLSITSSNGPKPVLRLEDGSQGLDQLRTAFTEPLWLLMGMVALVLLAACFNVANLLLVQGSTRAHEMAIRLAIGATRKRLARQLLTESILLAAMGVAVGVLLAIWTDRLLVRFASEGKEIYLPVTIDWRLLAFTGFIAVVSTLLFGLLPAFVSSRPDNPAASPQFGRAYTPSRSLLRRLNGIMVLQIAVSAVVLSTAGLLTRSLYNLRNQDFGIRPENLLMVQIPLELTPAARQRQPLLRGEVLRRVRQLPGVASAAASCCGPFDTMAQTQAVSSEIRPQGVGNGTRVVPVTDDYLETMGMTVVAGRPLLKLDSKDGSRVAVLSQKAATQLFGREPAIGRKVSLSQRFEPSQAVEVVGIVKDSRFGSPREEFGPLVFVPVEQAGAPITTISVRTEQPPLALAPGIRRAVQDAAP
ncbi:MAG TPA: ABC transporter permease, partial [Bryobacteraceae bacterium]|nr:ABC transporter permease [Bryobacteraceae bacterium]